MRKTESKRIAMASRSLHVLASQTPLFPKRGAVTSAKTPIIAASRKDRMLQSVILPCALYPFISRLIKTLTGKKRNPRRNMFLPICHTRVPLAKNTSVSGADRAMTVMTIRDMKASPIRSAT